MKVRQDFVTNSSSSSFIIARRDDCTNEDVKAILLKDREKLQGFLDDEMEYVYDCEHIKTVEDLVEELSSKIGDGYSPLQLNNWKVVSQEGSNEDGALLGMFLYCCLGKIDEEKLKAKYSD